MDERNDPCLGHRHILSLLTSFRMGVVPIGSTSANPAMTEGKTIRKISTFTG
jgi:hypothetical protein